jgi:hypothetical protein
MRNLNRTLTLILIGVIAVSCVSLLSVKPANAQSLTTPSVPEFTVKFVDRSYDAAPSTTTNPYTGQQITNEAHHVENRTIELTIKNQPFTSYQQNGENISFYYNVREKGPYEENWTNVYTVDNYFTAQSNTDNTTLVYLIDANAPPLGIMLLMVEP